MLHGGPPRGPSGGQPASGSPSGYSSQDARGNLAVQPAASPAKINLKKAAVKKVVPTIPPVNVLQNVAAPVVAYPKQADGYELPKASTPTPRFTPAESAASLASLKARLDRKATPPKGEVSPPKIAAETDLDDMFARLTSGTIPSPKAVGTGLTLGDVGISAFSFDDEPAVGILNKLPNAVDLTGSTAAFKKGDEKKMHTEIASEKNIEAHGKPQVNQLVGKIAEIKIETETRDINKWEGMTKEDLEREYLNQASRYLTSLSTTEATTSAHLVKSVFIKLRRSFGGSMLLDLESVDTLKRSLVDAICTYIAGLPSNGAKSLEAAFVEQILKDNDGDFLQLCAKLVDEKCIQLENLDEVVGLCRAIIEIIPKDDIKTKLPGSRSTTAPGENLLNMPANAQKPPSKDPMDNMTAWPTQQKRENVVGCRTCILKGVSGITTINQLQAYVWGGRLESISHPVPGSDFALVKFLTSEGCQKFFDETENGIELHGDKKTLITVEKMQGPNSVNDLLRNCTDGDGSRCVRAYDADKDWGDTVLKKLAVGQSTTKREIDVIKRGQTAKGRFYIEFRFASIYHALSFKHDLTSDEDWEHCTINFAKDPCETARGVHLKDEDEDSGFVA